MGKRYGTKTESAGYHTAYNEAENIVHVVRHMTETAPQYDYLVINDGSTDNTPDLCRSENFHYLDLSINMGIGGAVQAGYIYARKNNYDIAVQMDGDGQHDIAYLDKLLEPLIRGGGYCHRLPISGKGGVSVLRNPQNGDQYLKCTDLADDRKHIMDVTSGYRAVNKLFIKIYSEDYPMDYPEPEAIVAAIMHLGRVKEVRCRCARERVERALLLSKICLLYD